MKYISILLLILLTSCNIFKPCTNKTIEIPIYDTIYVTDTIYVDTFKDKYVKIVAENDSIKAVNDTLSQRLLLANTIIEDIRYYVRIVKNNSSQSKFLLGWIRRPLGE